jgi:sphingomyelin phosphodiesterase acid-like 3
MLSPQFSPGESSPEGGQFHRTAGSANAKLHAIPALLVSDIHFDPFHDPPKVQRLVDAPMDQWSSILSAPPSPNQQQEFAALQQKCHARGIDTPYALLQSSLKAMRSQRPDAKFMIVSGDLIAHSFFCRYTTLISGTEQGDYQSFVLKTLSFVMGELRGSFPGIPVYPSIGNNDTACDDYRLDTASDFLARAGRIVAEGLPPARRQEARRTFALGGYYSLDMGATMGGTRLVVVNDVFLSPRYRTCGGVADPVAATAEIAWLHKQLAQARHLGQRVWVMGHIPPGIDSYATSAKTRDICGNQTPEVFLSSDKLANLLIEYADVVRLGIFAHSHMDEMRLLGGPSGGPHRSFERSVAIKVVPSISPVDGNSPSFTIALVNQSSAVLENYQVVTASNQSGDAAIWSTEYDYAETYHEVQFSPSTVGELIADFEKDRGAQMGTSQKYIRNYFAGGDSSELKPFWPQYVCAMANHTAKAFVSCACSVGK